MFFLNIFLYTLYTVGGSFIYYPSFFVNIPNSTLEQLIPTNEGCKEIIGDKLTCKKKLKCFFKRCSILEDPIGSRLEQQIKNSKKTKKGSFTPSGGGKKNKTKKKKFSVNNLKLLKKINKLTNRDKKKYIKLIKYLSSIKKGAGNSLINQNTCLNKATQIFCHKKGKNIIYPASSKEERQTKDFLKMFKNMTQRGGNNTLLKINNNLNSTKHNLNLLLNFLNKYSNVGIDNEEMLVDSQLIESLLEMYFDNESLYKLLISYYILKELFGKNMVKSNVKSVSNINSYNGIDVVFPWDSDSHKDMTIEEKKSCLFKHLTNLNIGDEYETNDFYQKCFICKNCTLLNTSLKAWEGLFSSLFTPSENELKTLSKDLYNVLMKNITFDTMDVNNYYNISLYAMNLLDKDLDINQLKSTFKTKTQIYTLPELIFGIPKVKKVSIINSSDILGKKFKEIFVLFQDIQIEKLIHKLCYDKLYHKINHVKNENERLYFIKQCIKNRIKLFYGNENLFLKNNEESDINIDELKKYRIHNENGENINILINNKIKTDFYQKIFYKYLNPSRV